MGVLKANQKLSGGAGANGNFGKEVALYNNNNSVCDGDYRV